MVNFIKQWLKLMILYLKLTNIFFQPSYWLAYSLAVCVYLYSSVWHIAKGLTYLYICIPFILDFFSAVVIVISNLSYNCRTLNSKASYCWRFFPFFKNDSIANPYSCYINWGHWAIEMSLMWWCVQKNVYIYTFFFYKTKSRENFDILQMPPSYIDVVAHSTTFHHHTSYAKAHI